MKKPTPKAKPKPKALPSLRSENERLKLIIQNGRMRREAALYDAVEGSGGAVGTGNKRRQARLETQSEDDLFPIRKRNMGLNLQREALRNYATHRGQIHQLKINTVGPMGRLYCLADPTGWGAQAQDWFNGVWAENAEFRAGLHWGELLQLTVAALANDNDMVAAFDDGTITGGTGTGRIVTWESDQIPNLASQELAVKFPNCTQDNGLLRDPFGREFGVVVTGARGLQEVAAKDAFILTRDPLQPRRDGWWVYVKRQFRLVQGRGISPSITSIPLAMDAYEILSKEMQVAKLRAGQAAFVKRKEAVTDFDDPAFDPTNPEGEGTGDVAAGTLPEDQEEPTTYERLEALTGGYTEYLDADDEVTMPTIDRPNVDLPAFLDYVTDGQGQVFGLAHAYARLKAESSYTAFRGDMVMTWVSVKDNQKMIERSIADWAAVQAIRWAMNTGRLPAGPAGWERMLAWQWPRMPEVNEKEYQTGIALALKNGTITYQDLLGPHWRERFHQIGEELKVARAESLPLAIFETKAGAPAAEQPQDAEGNPP